MLTLAQVVLRNNCATKVVAAISVASWKLHATPVYTPRDAGVVSIALQPHAANGKGVSGPFFVLGNTDTSRREVAGEDQSPTPRNPLCFRT